jgi:hypothetical protein
MKKILLPILLLLFLVRPQLKAQVPAALNGYYQNYYRIFDNQKNYSLDKSSNTNVYGSSAFHGGNNQQWIIMPTHVGSQEYYIASKNNGSILDINSHGNVYASDAYAHGGDNQIMKLTQVPNSSRYYISSNLNSQKVFDLSLSSQTKDPFIYPSSSSNNIYFGNLTGGANQQFTLNSLGGVPSPMWEYRTINNNSTPQPPSPTNLQGAGLLDNTPETFKAEAIIPFTMVENDMSRTQQVNYSPFYRVERTEFYRRVGAEIFPAGTVKTMTNELTVGTTNTQVDEIEKTLKVSFDPSGEINFKLSDNISAKIAAALGISYSKTTKSVTTYSQNYSNKQTSSSTFTASSQTLIAEYQLFERYRLYRMDGTQIRTWDVGLGPSFNTKVSYVCGTNCRVAYAGEIVVKSQGYTSNNTYHTILGYEKELEHNSGFVINSVYPNPFQSKVKVDLSTPESANVQVELYNLLGQKVKHIDKVISLGGNISLEVDGSNLPEGIYVIKVEATAINDRKKKFSYQQKLILRR